MSDSTPNPPAEGGSYQPPPPPTSEQPTAPPGGAPGGQPLGGYPPSPGQGSGQGYGPGYGAGYGAPPTGGVGQPADLLMRFLARLIDGILIGIVNFVIKAVLVVGVLGLSSGGGLGFSTGDTFAASAISAVISTVLYLGYFTILESRSGQTIGKMLLKLQTQGPDGSTPTTEQAFKRNAWSGLGILGIVPILGIIAGLAQLVIVILIAVTISQSPVREGWHDRFAGGTKVMKIG